MIEQLFPRDWGYFAMSAHGDVICDFADWIVRRGYSRICSRVYVRHLRKVLAVNDVERDAMGRIRLSTVDGWFLPLSHDSIYCATRRAVVRYLMARSLLVSDAASGPLEAVVGEYRTFLLTVRGLSATTTGQHARTVKALIDFACPDPQRLARLRQQDIEAFVERSGTVMSRPSLQHEIAHLRSFLRFCADRGYTKSKLDVIDMPRVYRGELPPRALDWPMVCKLLDSIDTSAPEGLRDHAILYLMAHFGLRPSEVAALTVDAIDWTAGKVRVEQRKTRSSIILPLDEQARRVIRRYLDARRPDSPWKEIFLKVRCPPDPIKAATIDDIFSKRLRLSGLSVTASGPYSLRHSFAMRLLQKGVGIKTIGDLLGHRSLESTCVYLRLHVEALREVGLPVPHAPHKSQRAAS